MPRTQRRKGPLRRPARGSQTARTCASARPCVAKRADGRFDAAFFSISVGLGCFVKSFIRSPAREASARPYPRRRPPAWARSWLRPDGGHHSPTNARSSSRRFTLSLVMQDMAAAEPPRPWQLDLQCSMTLNELALPASVQWAPASRWRIAEAGHEVTVWNRTQAKAQALIDAGLGWAATPRELAGSSDVLFTMLTDSRAILATADGDDGILAGLRPGTVWADLSTIAPDVSVAMAERASRARGVLPRLPRVRQPGDARGRSDVGHGGRRPRARSTTSPRFSERSARRSPTSAPTATRSSPSSPSTSRWWCP